MPSSLVQQQFGANAAAYVASQVHAQGQSLQRMLALAEPQSHWLALDVAPGGGHSALAVAKHVAAVVALDLTPEMLQAARAYAQSLDQHNLAWVQGDGHELPLPAAAFDLVTCRVALHHFPDQPAAIREWARVLKQGGRLVLVDNIAPDDPEAAAYVNAFEKLRDPSHGWMHPLSELSAFVQASGLRITHEERLVKPMSFPEWMRRMNVSAPDQQRLTGLLWSSQGPARAFLHPQGEGEHTTFNLHEGIIVAHKLA